MLQAKHNGEAAFPNAFVLNVKVDLAILTVIDVVSYTLFQV